MKIAVYTITKNEEQFIARWAESCKEADYRLIVDTGSIDNTIEEAKKAGCEVASISISPWRFDDARNAALALVPHDIDMCVSLDADEMLMPGWREHLESLPEDITRPRYKYVWSWNPDGSEGLTFYRDHIHKRQGYRWVHPVHEVVVSSTGNEKQAVCGLEVHHHPDASKSRGQYLPLLELAVKEDPTGDRNMFYLGREYMYYGRNTEAEIHLKKHLELSGWNAERSASMRYLSKVTNDKETWLLKACAEAPDRREPWVDSADYYYKTYNWPQCYAAAKRALGIVSKPLDYICEADAWGPLPHDLAGISAWYLGMKDEALFHTLNALSIDPNDSRIRSNAAMMYKDMRDSDVHVVIPSKSNIEGLTKLVEFLMTEKSVAGVCVVADGQDAYNLITEKFSEKDFSNVDVIESELGKGIQRMWNLGLDHFPRGSHVLFVNDDIEMDEGAVDVMAGYLDKHLEFGLTCPNYDKRLIKGHYESVTIACPGNYDGTDGLAGSCMMLRKDLAEEWRFDERMIWWYGDNDLINWTIERGRLVVICSVATMGLNPSWTMRNDPPDNFHEDTDNDKKIYEKKWGSVKND